MSGDRPGEHLPQRPSWNCRECGQTWPCTSAKAELLHEFRVFPSVLRIYLSGQMWDALADTTANGRPPRPTTYTSASWRGHDDHREPRSGK